MGRARNRRPTLLLVRQQRQCARVWKEGMGYGRGVSAALSAASPRAATPAVRVCQARGASIRTGSGRSASARSGLCVQESKGKQHFTICSPQQNNRKQLLLHDHSPAAGLPGAAPHASPALPAACPSGPLHGLLVPLRLAALGRVDCSGGAATAAAAAGLVAAGVPPW